MTIDDSLTQDPPAVHDQLADSADDADLLARLRDGDSNAYTALWTRHIGAALRLGNRLTPGRGDDLASEAFLAVYRQVTTTDSGPTKAFRAYLFTVMRNTAMRWNRESNLIDLVDEVDEVDEDDALRIVERQSDASELLEAFQDLPERWQHVLWLSEVEEISRPKIAAKLGIRPNAVSSLQRRARSGLRLSWLERQVPVHLKDSSDHVGSLLPDYVGGERRAVDAARVDAHLPTCRDCSELLSHLQSASTRIQRTTLSAVGFAALGTVVSASAPAAPAAAIGGIALLASGLGVGSVSVITAGSLTAITIGAIAVGALSVGLLTPSTPSATAEPGSAVSPLRAAQSRYADDTPESQRDLEDGAPSDHEVTADDPQADDPPTDAPPLGSLRTGRHNDDPSVPEILLGSDSDGSSSWLRPDPPTPAPVGSVPDPGQDDGPDGDDSDDTGQGDVEGPTPGQPGGKPVLSPGVSTPTTVKAYLAPVLAGSTRPGAEVAVEFEEQRYLPAVASDGEWQFDLRTLAPNVAGSYEYRVWAFTDDERSGAVTGTFDIVPIVVDGFTGTEGLIPIDEASTTGIVVSIQGPANGWVCIVEGSGATTEVPLDENGRTVGRIRVQEIGYYMFGLTACASQPDPVNTSFSYFGAPVMGYLYADDPDGTHASPWGPSPDDVVFDFPAR